MSGTYGGNNAFPALVTIPSDADPRNAASVNVALEGLADRTMFLKSNGMLDMWHVADNGDASTEDFVTAAYVASVNVTALVEGCKTNDILQCTFTGLNQQVGATGNSFLQVFAVDDSGGTPTGDLEVVGAGVKWPDVTTQLRAVALSGWHQVTKDGDVTIKLMGKITSTGGGISLSLRQKYALTITRWRPIP